VATSVQGDGVTRPGEAGRVLAQGNPPLAAPTVPRVVIVRTVPRVVIVPTGLLVRRARVAGRRETGSGLGMAPRRGVIGMPVSGKWS
jgi:hypothetical protein